jgi:glyoxylase-like metal-dependent hydrolase (beta-lactamase superfamily II)
MPPRFSLTFLGVGAGLSPELGNNNILIENEDRSRNLLVDCGPVTAHDLKLAGRLDQIQQVFITHVHDDHIGGLQLWAQLNRYVFRQKPGLFFRAELLDELWDGSLRGGLSRSTTRDGEPAALSLEDYFAPQPLADGQPLALEGLPTLTPVPRLHVKGKPSFGFFLGDDVFYSSDSQELPPAVGPTGKPLRAIFQDCQLFETGADVHTPLARLVRELPEDLKRITHLMHYNHPPDVDARAMGFAGFVSRHEPIWL